MKEQNHDRNITHESMQIDFKTTHLISRLVCLSRGHFSTLFSLFIEKFRVYSLRQIGPKIDKIV